MSLPAAGTSRVMDGRLYAQAPGHREDIRWGRATPPCRGSRRSGGGVPSAAAAPPRSPTHRRAS